MFCLLFYLYNGITLASLSDSENTPVEIDLLNILHNGSTK